jgi:hypothetical protein
LRKEYRDLVICNSCQWSASLLTDSFTFSRCPSCAADNIEIIPVEDYEKYNFSISKIRGIEVEFSDDRIRLKPR